MQGLIAGYGIAIPVGRIAILIIELGIREGFSVAFCAGAGAASADLVYATIASLAGSFLASILKPYSPIIRTVSALVLIALGLWLLYRSRRVGHEEACRFSRIYALRCLRFGIRVNPTQSADRSLLHSVDTRPEVKLRRFARECCALRYRSFPCVPIVAINSCLCRRVRT